MFSIQKTADSRRQTADSRQQTADSRQQTADSRQQTADSRQATFRVDAEVLPKAQTVSVVSVARK
jgi:hypothetical protein